MGTRLRFRRLVVIRLVGSTQQLGATAAMRSSCQRRRRSEAFPVRRGRAVETHTVVIGEVGRRNVGVTAGTESGVFAVKAKAAVKKLEMAQSILSGKTDRTAYSWIPDPRVVLVDIQPGNRYSVRADVQ